MPKCTRLKCPSLENTFFLQHPQKYNEFSKFFEPADQWIGVGGGGGGGGGAGFTSTPGIWRQPRNPKPITPYYTSEEGGCLYAGDNWRDHQQHDNEIGNGAGGTSGGAVATPHGTISLRLRNRIRVDMTIDRAVRVINFKVRFSTINNILDW